MINLSTEIKNGLLSDNDIEELTSDRNLSRYFDECMATVKPLFDIPGMEVGLKVFAGSLFQWIKNYNKELRGDAMPFALIAYSLWYGAVDSTQVRKMINILKRTED